MMRGITTSARIDMITTTTINSSKENPASPPLRRAVRIERREVLICMVKSVRKSV
jgi:hypothetical protein